MFIIILLFIIFSIIVFFVNNLWILIGVTISNILLHIFFKISLKKSLKNIFKILFLVLFIFLFNLIFDNVISCLLISWKILIVANGAFIFSCKVSPTKLAYGLQQLFFPLKIFKVDTNNLSLMIVIALNFIPIISRDISTLKETLYARNVKLNLKTFLSQSYWLFIIFFANMFKNVDDIEMVLISRGYKQ